jgi:hypothetical protein
MGMRKSAEDFAKKSLVLQLGRGIEGAAEPGEGVADFVADHVDGLVEGVGGFLGGHAGEEAHFDESDKAWVFRRETVHGLVDGQQVGGGLGGGGGIIQGNWEARAAFLGTAGTGVIDQHLTHDAGDDAEEVGAIVEIRDGVAEDAEEGLVNEGRGLESYARKITAHMGVGETVKLGIDQREEEV